MITQQEILLIMDANFLTGQYSEKDEGGNKNSLTRKEQLEEACWNGSLSAMLPEVFDLPGKNKQLYLWQIMEGNFFINLELGESPAGIDKQFSINPYIFLSHELFS